jgi:hypothetical protein
MLAYKIFYPNQNGGKYHTCDKITSVATCGNFLVDQRNDVSIHLEGNAEINKVHPMVCKRCLAGK